MRSFTIAQSNQKTQGFPNAKNNNKNRDHSIFLKTSCNVKKKIVQGCIRITGTTYCIPVG